MKGYSPFPNVVWIGDPQFCVIFSVPSFWWEVLPFCRGYSESILIPTHWANERVNYDKEESSFQVFFYFKDF